MSRSCACPTTPRARRSRLCDELGARAPRLLDASTAHRVAPGWVYGFAELAEGQAERIAGASRVANPGCYATGAIALLRPLVDAGLVVADMALTINAVSGYSGGGRQMIEAYEAEQAPPFELYALGFEHKHLPEIAAFARLSAAAAVRAVGREFPARNAGLDSAPSRRAAGAAQGGGSGSGFGAPLRGRQACARVFRRLNRRGWTRPR